MTPAASISPGPQRIRALERANEVRLAWAELKRRIATGHLSAAEVILEPPHDARSWPIGELLQAQRHWGSTKCTKFLSRNQIDETKPLRGLTQRQLLASELNFCRQQTTETERALSA